MKLAIFDVDGTLVDSRSMITASMQSAFEAVGLPPPHHQSTLSVVGLSLIDAVRPVA